MDGLPYEIRDELARPIGPRTEIPSHAVQAALEAAYGDVHLVFARFDPVPTAHGSIGQIHRARLAGDDGTEVCVKIRYPDIERIIRSDFRTLKTIAALFDQAFTNLLAKDLLSRWEENVLQECNLELEARDHAGVAAVLRETNVLVPQVFAHLSRPNILVTEFVDGQSFEDFAANASQAEKNQIGIQLWKSQYHGLKRGIWRYDVQPGNYLIKDGRLWVIDLAATLIPDTNGMASHLDFMRELAKADSDAVAKRFLAEGWTTDEEAARRAAKVAVRVLGRPLQGGVFKFEYAFVTEVFTVMTQTLRHDLKVPRGTENMVRIFWSLWSLLAQLRASADWSLELKDELDLEPARLGRMAS